MQWLTIGSLCIWWLLVLCFNLPARANGLKHSAHRHRVHTHRVQRRHQHRLSSGHGHRHQLQHRGRQEAHHIVSSAQQSRHVTAHNRSHREDLEEGGETVDDLNTLIYENLLKKDVETLQCTSAEEALKCQLEEVSQASALLSADAAEAREAVLKAQTQIQAYDEQLPQAKQEVESQKVLCSKQEAQIKELLSLVKGDLGVMEQAAEAQQCDEAAALLLHCHSKNARHNFTALRQSHVRRAVRHLRSSVAKSLLRSSFSGATTSRSRSQRWPLRTSALATRGATCKKASADDCPSLMEKFMTIEIGLQDKVEELTEQLGALQRRCSDTLQNLQTQIVNDQQRSSQLQAVLADTMAQLNDAEARVQLKDTEHSQAQEELSKTVKDCTAWAEASDTELAGLQKIRAELTAGSGTVVEDCEVSDWIFAACSATCGGGTQKLTRSVIAHSNGGAACLPLESERPCNKQACPVDCVMGEWSEWSSCTAECGGGIMDRSRDVKRAAENNGAPCGGRSQAVQCSAQPCNQNCGLSEWSEWGSCSKACDQGLQQRRRAVSVQATGLGTCPSDDDPQRVENRACNEQACIPNSAPADTILRCESKVDVALALDGSASVGEEGWKSIIQAGAGLARAMDTGTDATSEVRMGSLLFSGPRNFAELRDCTGENGQASNCGMNWLSHLGAQRPSDVATAIEGAAWPRASTFISMALSTVKSEMIRGRQDAESVVVVVMEGSPLSLRSCEAAARDLRESGHRLVFVAVGPDAPIEDLKLWASRPVRDNVLVVPKPELLREVSTVNTIVASVCPKVSPDVSGA